MPAAAAVLVVLAVLAAVAVSVDSPWSPLWLLLSPPIINAGGSVKLGMYLVVDMGLNSPVVGEDIGVRGDLDRGERAPVDRGEFPLSMDRLLLRMPPWLLPLVV